MRWEKQMRKLVIVLSLVTWAVSAAPAQIGLPTESVIVSNDSLSGIWKIRMPEGWKAGVLGKTEWGAPTDKYCRIEEFGGALTIHCPGLRLSATFIDRGIITIAGNGIRLVWGSRIRRAGLIGTVRSNSAIEGTFFIEYFGISSDDPAKLTATKLSLSESTPDKAGKAAFLGRLIEQLAQGTPPVDTGAGLIRFPTPDQLRPLGPVQTMIYLGEFAPSTDRPYDVYDVEFSGGNLICELRQRADDTIDGFVCG
jgi:hypothetical protein